MKLLDGTRADRINGATPAPKSGRPECPDYLDATARKEWDRIVPILEGMGVLTQADGASLALYCSAHSDLIDALAMLKKVGKVVKTGAGGVKPSPYLQIANQARHEMARLLAEFGCSPSSRSRINVTTAKAPNKLEVFMAKKKQAR